MLGSIVTFSPNGDDESVDIYRCVHQLLTPLTPFYVAPFRRVGQSEGRVVEVSGQWGWP